MSYSSNELEKWYKFEGSMSKVMNGNLDLRDKIDVIIEKRVTKFGSGAKIDCPKEYLGRRAYILICKDEE